MNAPSQSLEICGKKWTRQVSKGDGIYNLYSKVLGDIRRKVDDKDI